jgi:hypothetical protein
MAKRFAAQSLHVGRANDLVQLARRWAMSGQAGVGPAEELLTCGLRHTREGWRVRQQFYEWSTTAELHANLAYLVIALSVQEIAPDQPKQALVRLHHLYVDHSDRGVSRSAGDVLVELAGKAGFLRRLLSRLAESQRARMAVPLNHDLFLRIADPERLTDAAHRSRPLIADPVVRSQLVTCWQFVLAGRRAGYDEVVRTWLTVHAHTDGSDPLLGVLVEACGGAIEPLSDLFVIGLGWLHRPSPADDEVAAQRIAAFWRLDAAINRARADARDGFGMSG